MEIIKAVLFIVGIIANGIITAFAGYSFVVLRKIRKEQAKVLLMVMGDHVRNNFAEVNRMKATLHELIEKENFEETKEFKAVIEKAEESAMRSLQSFKEIFGNDICELNVTKLNKYQKQ